MAEEKKNQRYEQAASMVKVQGVMSIIFGAIGCLVGLIFLAILAVAIGTATTEGDAFAALLFFLLIAFLWFLPHLYFIVAGITLLHLPEPRVVKTLTIINLIVGFFWNYILLVFAIISLVQSVDYADDGKVSTKR